jgi:glycosyltransferase involved in cell wall biosynthesis
MSISLCTFVKNEAHCIDRMFDSVKPYVKEIVVVDTGSEDGTVKLCKAYGARVYEVGFSDFGKIRTLAAHLAREEWIFMLDADEEFRFGHRLQNLIDYSNSQAYSFPRKRWLDINTTKQTEVEAYPDLQVRLFKNNPKYIWKRELHEYFDGASVQPVFDIWIDHFHDVHKTPERLQERSELYTRLAAQAGVNIEGGKKLEGV